MKAKDALGRRGEQLAADYLAASGMAVVDRNWRCSLGEIDLVAHDGPTLVIVEVKTRTSDAYGHPFEAITPVKLRRLHHLAGAWREAHPETDRHVTRIDVIGILCPSVGDPSLEHLREVC